MIYALEYEIVSDCMINHVCSSLPFLFVCVICVVLSFCDDHQFIDVSRCENSPWSSGWWRFRCIAIWAGFLFTWVSFRVMAHVFSCLWALFWNIVDLLLHLVTGIVVCLRSFLVFLWTIVRNSVHTPRPCFDYYFV